MSSALDHAKALISKASISPNDVGCQAYLQQQLEKLNFHLHSFDQNNTKNTFAQWGNGQPSLLFVGHTDVVPPGDLAAWHTPPFQPTIQNNQLIGRGAVDMKSSLAAMLHAQTMLLETNVTGTLAWLITSDEEADGFDGIRSVIPKLKAQGHHFDYAIVGEPTSHHAIGDTLKIGRRGSLHATLVYQGKQGHVAYPHLANNPNHPLIDCLSELLSTQWDEQDPHPFPPTSMQITNMASGANACNVIPATAQAHINFRHPSHTPYQSIQEKVSHVLTKHQPHISCQWQIAAQPYYSPPGSLVELTQKALSKLGIMSHLSTEGGTSDGRFLSPICGQIMELGPGHHQAHQCNESIGLEELETLTSVYYHVLRAVMA